MPRARIPKFVVLVRIVRNGNTGRWVVTQSREGYVHRFSYEDAIRYAEAHKKGLFGEWKEYKVVPEQDLGNYVEGY